MFFFFQGDIHTGKPTKTFFFYLILVIQEKWYKQEKLNYWRQDFFSLSYLTEDQWLCFILQKISQQNLVTASDVHVLILLLVLAQTSRAVEKSRSLQGGPSVLMLMSTSSLSAFSLFLKAFFIQFCALKPLSQPAVLVAEHCLLFTAQPCVISQPSFFLINTLFFVCTIFLWFTLASIWSEKAL